MKAVALLGCVVGAEALKIEYPRVAFHKSLHLPLRGQSQAGDYNLIFVAEEGHDVVTAQQGICSGIENAFDATSYRGRCEREIRDSIRHYRGLALQHDAKYALAVQTMEERLGNEGYVRSEFGTTMYNKPFRASFLNRAASAPGGVKTYCEVGFGAGHSTLLMLNGLPEVRVHVFDKGTARYAIPAHDYLDDRYPERFYMYLGDSQHTVPRMIDYFPGDACDLVYLDGSTSFEDVKADLSNFQKLTSNEHTLVLANAVEGSETLRAWDEMVRAGKILWEGTILESPGSQYSDAVVYGRYVKSESAAVPAA